MFLQFKIACRYFNPKKNHPFIFETMIISAAVLVMCPIMSFIAAILYYPYNFMEFNVVHFLAEWLNLVCYNFPFAFFSQLFFIQPIMRTVFKTVFKKDIQKRKEEALEKEKNGAKYINSSVCRKYRNRRERHISSDLYVLSFKRA